MYFGMRNLVAAALFLESWAHQQHDWDSQLPLRQPDSPLEDNTWLEKYGPQIDQAFSGPLSFSHLPYFRCLENAEANFDIAILGMPFDTAVTYRPGYCILGYCHNRGLRRLSIQSQGAFWAFCYSVGQSSTA